jgi:hypothetical protein
VVVLKLLLDFGGGHVLHLHFIFRLFWGGGVVVVVLGL